MKMLNATWSMQKAETSQLSEVYFSCISCGTPTMNFDLPADGQPLSHKNAFRIIVNWIACQFLRLGSDQSEQPTCAAEQCCSIPINLRIAWSPSTADVATRSAVKKSALQGACASARSMILRIYSSSAFLNTVGNVKRTIQHLWHRSY